MVEVEQHDPRPGRTTAVDSELARARGDHVASLPHRIARRRDVVG
jgi:hypothetical protein